MDWWTEGFADVNQRSDNDDTLLCLAAREGHASVVLALLEKGAETKVDALYSATSIGHEVIARLLIERGVDINALNKYNKSALFAASNHNHEDMVRFLLDNGAKVDDEAFIAASRRAGVKVVRLLLDGGAKVNDEALEWASKSGHEVVVRLLLDRGANASAGALRAASVYGHKKVLQLLKEARKSPEDHLSSIAMLFECEGS